MIRKIKKIPQLSLLSQKGKLKFLKILRKRIDFYDRIIVLLLNKRAKNSLLIGKIKKSLNQPIYVPERERSILQKIKKANHGPLNNESLERIFERILDQSRATQKSESKKK